MRLILGAYEGLVQWLHNNMEEQGAVHEIFRCPAVQVSFGQEIAVFLCALVEVVDVLHHHLPLLLSHHQHRLLEAHSSKVGAGRGRRDDDARTPAFYASRLHGARLGVHGPHAQGQPARGEQDVPSHAFVGVMVAGPQLGLETHAAVVPCRVVDDPGGPPHWGQVVPGHKEATVHVKVFGHL